MRFKPFKAYYEVVGEELIVNLCGRSESGERVVKHLTGTRPYLFVPAGTSLRSGLVTDVERDWGVSIRDEPVDKVYAKYPFDLTKLRAMLGKTYEADISYENRIRYDLNIKNVIEVPLDDSIVGDDIAPVEGVKITPRIAVIDIETGGFSEPRVAAVPVTSIAIWDSFTDQYVAILNGKLSDIDRGFVNAFIKKEGLKAKVIETSGERQMFSVFNQWLNQVKPDILTGWNFTKFDIEFMKNRCKNENIAAPNWKEYAMFDLMDAFERQHEGELESKGLDFVSKSLGLEGKTTKKSVVELYNHARGEFLAYNLNDVFITKEVMLKKDLMNFFLELCAFAGCGIEDGLATGRLVDSFMFHRLKGVCVQPSKENMKWDSIQGATVMEPSKGIFPNVTEVDFTGEYAAIIRTFNLSPETIVSESYKGDVFILPSGNRYRKSPRGYFPSALDELTGLRAEKKRSGNKEEERVVKEYILTFYGVLASDDYRNSDPRIGGDITGVAREHLAWNKRLLTEKASEVLA